MVPAISRRLVPLAAFGAWLCASTLAVAAPPLERAPTDAKNRPLLEKSLPAVQKSLPAVQKKGDLQALKKAPLAALLTDAPWAARHGLTSDEYQKAFDDFAKKGFRLRQVSGSVKGGKVVYAALWEKVSGPPWKARHGLTAEAYQKAFDDYGKQGYRLVFVDGYEVGGSDRYAAIWEKRDGPAYIARHGLTGAAYQDVFDELTGKGYRLVHVDGYTKGGSARYAAIFEKSSGPAWKARHGLSPSGYQQAFEDYAKQGYRPVLVSGARVGDTDRYAAIWHKTSSLPWSARHGIPGKWYQNVFDNFLYQSYRPRWINSFTSGNQTRFNGVWTNSVFKASDLALIREKAEGYLSTYGYPGLSFAIVKDGKLLYAAGFGKADPSTGEEVGPRSRFRIASVAKPITGATMVRLAQKNEVNLDGKVFGPNGYLGDDFDTPAGEEDLEDMTVRQLLQHTAGFGTVDSGGDPMFKNTSLDHADLIEWALGDGVLNQAPGSLYEYSNFGFCLAGRVIEKVTGKSYAQAVKDEVLKPSGVTGMEIALNEKSERQAYEVVYSPDSAYTLNVTRFDAHGGWIATPIDLLRFLVHVDGSPTKPDVINGSSHTTMTTKSGIQDADGMDRNYALGWGVGGNNQSHNGSMAGTLGQLVARNDGWSLAAVTNQRSDADKWAGNLEDMVEEIIAGVSDWPDHDLF